ncbi:hypothetical protein LR48_Vigan02g212700 [Vigna angularis]|uniref:Longin domain-containing protein n=1 Tax=Phaseolus angularis TaxID=3914 RepID=A0A0L9U004_PHAAN|nr:hypothetical protein LR48_Vigan02g212700 [Vigna angularis]
MVENGVVFIVLSESTYPRKLAFHYLQDIQKEFEKFDKTLIGKITSPYSFIKFDGIIANISRQYIDTRTQANLSKLNANRKQDVDVASQDFYDIVERKRNSGDCFGMDTYYDPCNYFYGSSMGYLSPHR